MLFYHQITESFHGESWQSKSRQRSYATDTHGIDWCLWQGWERNGWIKAVVSQTGSATDADDGPVAKLAWFFPPLWESPSRANWDSLTANCLSGLLVRSLTRWRDILSFNESRSRTLLLCSCETFPPKGKGTMKTTQGKEIAGRATAKEEEEISWKLMKEFPKKIIFKQV